MPFIEYSIREMSEPLRQGDIFNWKGPDNDPWQKFGIVITADCDLEHRKHRNLLSYCPILPFQDFLKLFWVADDIARYEKKQIEKVAQRLTKSRQQHRPEYEEPVSESIVSGWLIRRGVKGIIEDVGEPEGKTRSSLIADLELLKDLKHSSENDNLKNQLSIIAKARLQKPLATEAEIATAIKTIWKDYVQKISSLPGDLFFLNELSSQNNEGYVVYLRRISEIKPDDVAITQLMARTSKAVRISQLRATFRYRLTQKLAAVFTDIGLPTEYEDLCSKTMAIVAINLDIPTN